MIALDLTESEQMALRATVSQFAPQMNAENARIYVAMVDKVMAALDRAAQDRQAGSAADTGLGNG